MTPSSPIEQHEEEDVLGYSSSDSPGPDEHDLFTEVIKCIRLDRLAKYATTIRQSTQHSNPQSSRAIEIKPPIFGSYHVLFPVRFHDGTLWLLKVPANGTRERFRASDARAIRSEALTMRFLRRETTIPVPDVHAFSDTCDNELHCPFILIDHVEGVSLYKVWFDNASPKEIVQARRTRCLRDLAAAMAQLGRFSSCTGGYRNDAGTVKSWRSRPIDSLLGDGALLQSKRLLHSAAGLSNRARHGLERGVLGLLRLFIDWIPEPSDELGAFVLAHPDLDVQNVLVSRDGALQAIIDWDGVGVVPRSVGNERFPSWLIRDWDPAIYCWTEEIERRAEPLGLWEDSPDTLRFYRSVYTGFIQSHLLYDDDPECANLTTRSLILRNLLNAANDPYGTVDVVQKVFNTVVSLAQEGVSTRQMRLVTAKVVKRKKQRLWRVDLRTSTFIMFHAHWPRKD
ncbi:hypothetical protein ANOM_008263 [Aspergillus nomiae NRRL 13137]|uniref:Aminoglycoside phosphotransferase domain-containing protein n=1 Tax=Aspergillus nomiae NRRL (strain ATCC 15546 / NRRL 13137 / CBS 260.88 / M93) TaxID=1509407 RepID=A0A0L1IUT9_ASPN3|nr:uncharacterized protein ANOM_008263 [Aspergillus nomiae NRRL 13137]KNG83254.1 hypothetical protein ANOM_008263 [Aspergillus nomiae NRRL 13137]